MQWLRDRLTYPTTKRWRCFVRISIPGWTFSDVTSALMISIVTTHRATRHTGWTFPVASRCRADLASRRCRASRTWPEGSCHTRPQRLAPSLTPWALSRRGPRVSLARRLLSHDESSRARTTARYYWSLTTTTTNGPSLLSLVKWLY